MNLHLLGLSCLTAVWHFPDCASSFGFSKLSASVFSCLVCSVVGNTQICTDNSLLIQIHKFWVSHAEWSRSLSCNFSLGLVSRVCWADAGGSGKDGAFASRQGKLYNYLLWSHMNTVGRNLSCVILALWPKCELSYSFWL